MRLDRVLFLIKCRCPCIAVPGPCCQSSSRPLPGMQAIHAEHALAGAMLSEYQQVTSLIKYLQSMRGRRLWPHQDASLLEPNPPSNIALTALANAVSNRRREAINAWQMQHLTRLRTEFGGVVSGLVMTRCC